MYNELMTCNFGCDCRSMCILCKKFLEIIILVERKDISNGGSSTKGLSQICIGGQ